MRKITLLILIIVIVLLSLFTLNIRKIQPASIKIGYVNMPELLIAHPGTEKAKKELNEFIKEREKDLEKKFGGKELTEKEREQATLLTRRYEDEIARKDAELTDKLRKDIEEMVKKVAIAEKLDIVLEEQVVIYGGVDITEKVRKKLQKK